MLCRSIIFIVLCLVATYGSGQCLTEGDGIRWGHFRSILEDHHGVLWLASTHGIYRWDGYRLHHTGVSQSDKTLMTDHDINIIYRDTRDRIWIGSNSYGLAIYEPKTNSAILFESKGVDSINDFPIQHIWSIVQQKNQVFIGGREGLVIFDAKDLSYEYHDIQTGVWNSRPTRRNLIRIIIPQDSNNIYLGGHFGLGQYNIQSRKFEHFPSTLPGTHDIPQEFIDQGWQPTILNGTIYNGNVYMTTWSSGVCKFDPVTRQWTNWLFEPFSIEDGIANNNILQYSYFTDNKVICSQEDHFERAYLEFDLAKEKFLFDSNYPPRPHNDQHTRAPYVDRNGSIVHTGHTYICFDEYYEKTSENQHQLRYLEISTDDILYSSANWSMTPDLLKLSHNTDSLHLEYGLINFPTDEEASYQYSRDGGRNWIDHAESRFLDLTDIPRGKSTMLVRGKSSHSPDWTQAPPLHIQKESALYQTNTFKGTAIGFLALLSAVIYYLRRRHRIKQDALELEYHKKLLDSQMTALRSQMNPHFLFNSLNSVNNYILQEDPRNASRYLTKFSRLMRMILNNSAHDLVSLEDEIETISLYLELEQLRLSGKFNYHLTHAEDLSLSSTMIPPLVVQPFVENAIWHGLMPLSEPRNVDISFLRVGDKIQCAVDDNGIGRKAAEKNKQDSLTRKKSLGLKLTSERIDLLQKTQGISTDIQIIDKNQDDKSLGTKVIITLPYIQADSI